MKTTINTLFAAATFAALTILSLQVLADEAMDQSKNGETMLAQAGAATDLAIGEVRKVDMAQGKVTLKHGAIKNLDMPPMTMVFVVKDKAMLDGVKLGDKVKFKAADENGKLTVVEMAPAN